MARHINSQEDIAEIWDELDISDPEDILSESDDEFIPQGNTSESEDDLEINSEESDVASGTESDDDSGECEEYIAKSGKVWKISVPPVTRRHSCNIVTGSPGPTRITDNATSMQDVFNLFVGDETVEAICTYTNLEATNVIQEVNAKGLSNRIRTWKNEDPVEMRAFFGVLLIAGALRCRKEAISEMWTTDESIRRAVFTASMPRDRFVHILQFIRFDDKSTRDQRKKNDKLAAFREIWDGFVENCKKLFEPFEEVTVDEQLVAFRGKCPMRQYMKSKPAKYGIKVWAAADVKTSYLYNLQVYTGRLPGNAPEKNQGRRVVCDMMKPLFGTGRSVTTDNFFTSVPTAELLLKKKITMTGTLRAKKPDIPAVMEIAKGRDILSSKFIFSDGLAVVSYVPKKKKTVRVLSSQYLDNSVSNEDHKKPNMILEYNRTKGGMDNADKLVREYTCARRTSRWPFRLFMNMLDIGTLNCYIIWMFKNRDWNSGKPNRRYHFLMALGKELTKPNILRRASNPIGFQIHVIRAIKSMGVSTGRISNSCTSSEARPAERRRRGRCFQCPRSNDRKFSVLCYKCKRFVCEQHRVTETTVTCTRYCEADRE